MLYYSHVMENIFFNCKFYLNYVSDIVLKFKLLTNDNVHIKNDFSNCKCFPNFVNDIDFNYKYLEKVLVRNFIPSFKQIKFCSF